MFTSKRITITIFLAVLYIIATNLAYMPGPEDPDGVVNRLHDLMVMLSIMSILLIPIGIIWIIVALSKNSKISWIPVLFTFVPIFAIVSYSISGPAFRAIGRNRSIDEAKVLIAAIESYHSRNGEYPENLKQLVPSELDAIPKPSTIGSQDFYYKIVDQSYELVFLQNIIFDFDVEHVTYNPPGSPEVTGFCYETGHENWKYCVPD